MADRHHHGTLGKALGGASGGSRAGARKLSIFCASDLAISFSNTIAPPWSQRR